MTIALNHRYPQTGAKNHKTRSCEHVQSIFTESVIKTLSQYASCYSAEKLCWAAVGKVTIVTACQIGGQGNNPFPTIIVNGSLFPLQTCGYSFLCCHLPTVSYLLLSVISPEQPVRLEGLDGKGDLWVS